MALKGGKRRLKLERENLRFTAWHMIRPHAGKDFPGLDAYMRDEPAPPPEPQSSDKIAAVLRRYGAGNSAITRTYPPGYTGPR